MVSFDPPNCLNLNQIDASLPPMVHLTGFAPADLLQYDCAVAELDLVGADFGATPLNCKSRDVVSSY